MPCSTNNPTSAPPADHLEITYPTFNTTLSGNTSLLEEIAKVAEKLKPEIVKVGEDLKRAGISDVYI